MGFQQDSRLYINESLILKSRELLKEVKAFKRDYYFKFVWTKQGKVLSRKEASPSSKVIAFFSIKEFEEFKVKFNQHSEAKDWMNECYHVNQISLFIQYHV